MKTAVLAAVAVLAAAPALAQTAPNKVQTSAPARMTVDSTPIEAIVANPAGKAVLDKDLPGLTQHPMYGMFKGWTLTTLAPRSSGKITDERLKMVQADLNQIQ